MLNDPVVNEIRAIRNTHAASFKYDVHAICDDYRRRQRESGREYISRPSRPVEQSVIASSASQQIVAAVCE